MSEISSGVRSLAAGWLVVGFTMVACIGPEVDPEVDADTGSTHALVTIDHRLGDARETDTDEADSQTAALAGFAQIPSDVDSEAVLTLAGWSLELPEPGSCVTLSAQRDQHTPLAPIERVELLEVGDVIIEAGDDTTQLAPRAFTGGNVVTGVLYTSRDPRAEPLPPGESYTIRTGGGALPALALTGEAPAPLSNVTLGGVPLTEVEVIALDEPLDLTWSVGAAGDLLYVELASEDGLNTTRCAFRDEEGAGTIGEGVFRRGGEGSLSVHRLRVLPIEEEDVRGELRFDVEQLVPIVFEG
jgi:hypothetical protein